MVVVVDKHRIAHFVDSEPVAALSLAGFDKGRKIPDDFFLFSK